VARAREAAKGIGKIHYGVVDLDRDELPESTYDVVVAHSVLHHVQNLEHAFAQLQRTMRPNATLIVNEYVGPNRFQFSDDVLSIMNALLACIGEPPKRRPTVEEMIANDPTEAVRSEELLPLLEQQFEVLERKPIGGTILQHLLYETIARFRFENAKERSILEMLCTIEAMLVDAGRIPCDYVILAARKRSATVQRANRPLPPRPEAANDVEGDPFWRGGGKGRLGRLALLARQPTRANLYEESKIAALFARFRKPPQHDPEIECLLRTAATLAAREAR
jgi:SAM-dependent methyltransferase